MSDKSNNRQKNSQQREGRQREIRQRKNYFQLSNATESPLDLYQHLPFQVAVVSNLLQLNRDPKIKNIIDLEPRELRVILNIGSYMPIKAADIAYQSRLDAYTVSRAVKELRKLGMIEAQYDEQNKKSKILTLTEQGQEVYRKLCDTINERTEKLETCLTATEKETLMSLLAKVEDKAESMLASSALESKEKGEEISAEQKEMIRWQKRSLCD